ncbi:MAG: pyruvate, phosphate dikinase [candidate division Zixibacteria bacterium]|nr:pyruvate, phosphate dikinase [candidate division Zixibacteria bacterium]
MVKKKSTKKKAAKKSPKKAKKAVKKKTTKKAAKKKAAGKKTARKKAAKKKTTKKKSAKKVTKKAKKATTKKKTTKKKATKKKTMKKKATKKKATKKKSVKTRVVKVGIPQKKTGASKKTPKGKYVYYFGDGKAEGAGDMKDLLGGKGAGLAEMTNAGVPVPPGFTITTEVCTLFYENNMTIPEKADEQMLKYLEKVEKSVGKKFGNPKDPLLVSVRSGAKFSMPGMMDTVLNLGLNDETVVGLAELTGNERFALDSYRRFIAMFGNVVLGIDKADFEDILDEIKEHNRLKFDTDLTPDHLKTLIERFKGVIREKTGEDFPQDPLTQLRMSRDAVFKSWNNPRAITYRKSENIPGDLGTAVNVQTMVFGNMGTNSATGVGFTRDPATGNPDFYGEYLTNAQGEDVVAGIRTPKHISELGKEMPKVYNQLVDITTKLEKHYRDIQDFEFTIQEGTLYMLQTRTGKRTAHAAVKIAVDMVKEKLITEQEALFRIAPESLNQLLHRNIDPSATPTVIARGLSASPGAASGKVVFNAEDAERFAEDGNNVILVRHETNPDDINGMIASRGILTSRGGMTSHAAVVARGMGKPCVAGCEEIKVYYSEKNFIVGEHIVKEGDVITLNGSTGEVMLGEVPTIEPELSGEFGIFMSWADKYRRLKIRTNADVPRDAEQAIKFGAEGIGLCRTEHMFFAEDRLPIVREMILAENEQKRSEALEKLLPFQKKDFKGLFEVMRGYPVTIRTIDPPLHEFLPKREELMVEIAEMKVRKDDPEQIKEKEFLLNRVEELTEFNPMLGHRGCRLGITYPEITEMQARAIFEAACEVAHSGKPVVPEVMIPLVGTVAELKNQKEIIVRVAEEVIKKHGVDLKYLVGTMIEIPRGALTADEIAEEADFFSFGTNDLTQMGFGYSRDDAAKFLRYYVDHGILDADPFVTLDQSGIGQLVRMGTEKGRATKKDLKVGICGEHGGDPKSIEFCNAIGLDYVSCSPFRVPIARLAAAQATLEDTGWTMA